MTSSDAETDLKPIIIIIIITIITVSSNFNKAMDVALDGMNCCSNPGEANQIWAHRDTVYATAASFLDYKKRKSQNWFDENDGSISCLLEQKRKE